MKCFVHQRYLTAPLAAAPDLPAVNANPLGGYFRPAAGNRLLCGIETGDRLEYRVPSPGFHLSSLTVDPELKARVKRDFSKLLPALRESEWESERVGLLTFSSDHEPILGPVETLPGLFTGLCFHSGGFAYNPVAGMLLAEYVCTGRTSIDISAFSPSRFAAEEVERFLGITIAQKDVPRWRH
jgi:glycine/D-amino acid oxidase-like deaminating enzyme